MKTKKKAMKKGPKFTKKNIKAAIEYLQEQGYENGAIDFAGKNAVAVCVNEEYEGYTMNAAQVLKEANKSYQDNEMDNIDEEEE